MSVSLLLSWDITSINQTSQRVYRVIDDQPETLLTTLDPLSTSYVDSEEIAVSASTVSYRIESVGVFRGLELVESSLPVEYIPTEPAPLIEPMRITTTGDIVGIRAYSPVTIVFDDGTTFDPPPLDDGLGGIIYQGTIQLPTPDQRLATVICSEPGPLKSIGFIGGLHQIHSWYPEGHTTHTAQGEVFPEIMELSVGTLLLPTTLHPTITNLNYFFFNARGFNQDISNWDTSNVTSMKGTFSNAFSFNQDIGLWNVSNVTDMTEMFKDARKFNQNLTQWCVANISETPTDYVTGASVFVMTNLPVWGACPRGENLV